MDSQKFYSRIDELGALLRAEGMAHGVDVWLSVARLFKRLEQQDKLPQDASELAPLLGPLFCRNPEEQARFPVLFAQWLNEETHSKLAAENRIDAPNRAALLAAQRAVQKYQKFWIAGSVAVIFCMVALLIVKAEWFLPQPANPPAKIIEAPPPKQPAYLIPRRKPQPAAATVTVVDRIAPRPQPQPDFIRQDWEPALRHIGWTLFVLPWLPVIGFLAWRYQRNAVLHRQSASSGDLLQHFHFDQVLQPIFGGAKAEQALRELHAARLEPTQQLNLFATIEATARAGGYFQPVYRNRRVAPQHLLLVRSQHRNDQQAALAEELEKRFKALGLPIKTYRFRDDPRWLVQWGDDKGPAKYYPLQQLAARYEDARLLIISETSILFHPYSGEIRSWLNDFNAWQDKVWLQPHDAGDAHAALLAQHHFLMLPLAQDNLPQLVQHLTKPPSHKQLTQAPQTLPLPATIAAEPDAWLGERPPYGADVPLLLRQLGQFLGANGLRLLRAVAVYPKPNWPLTRALDYLLFGGLNTATLTADPPQRREQRLARLSRLPWLKHAFLPDWLREALLLGMDRNERVHVATAWQRLFSQLTDHEGPQSLDLEVSVPSKLQLRVRFDDWRATSSDDAINDPIFANILRGGKLGLMDFRIPQAMAKLLPQNYQSWILRPALNMLLVTLFGTSVFFAAWHYFGQQAWIDYQRASIAQQNGQWPVTIDYREATQALMTALQANLESARFKVAHQSDGDETQSNGDNIIRYPANAQAAAERTVQSLKWLTYGAEVKLEKLADSMEKSIVIQLIKTYQHGTAFNDELHCINVENQNRLSFEPEMKCIPPGKFLMGSNNGDSDEQPVHEITIAYAFEISKFEVTFDEYHAFANATKRDQQSEYYSELERGNRPVIIISFYDAQAYVQWLSKQTGRKYRLPTEAEWEYVARAGTQTSYWWGDDIGKNNANCNGCGSQWDGKQTAQVGSFKPNPFGLYDTAGNVWEWTEDCWHDNYQGAPADGSAWKEDNNGDCSRRVIRGGWRSSYSQDLRSAVRRSDYPDVANNFAGFRIARDF